MGHTDRFNKTEISKVGYLHKMIMYFNFKTHQSLNLTEFSLMLHFVIPVHIVYHQNLFY